MVTYCYDINNNDKSNIANHFSNISTCRRREKKKKRS